MPAPAGGYDRRLAPLGSKRRETVAVKAVVVRRPGAASEVMRVASIADPTP